MSIELSCNCGNETEFTELTTTDFSVDAEENREDKINETTEYRCRNCGESAEVCDTSKDCEANGFHNTPAECEDSECGNCKLDTEQKIALDCPYLD